MESYRGFYDIHQIGRLRFSFASLERQGLSCDSDEQADIRYPHVLAHLRRILSFRLGREDEITDCFKGVVYLVHDGASVPPGITNRSYLRRASSAIESRAANSS
jgi:hypothetical protein